MDILQSCMLCLNFFQLFWKLLSAKTIKTIIGCVFFDICNNQATSADNSCFVLDYSGCPRKKCLFYYALFKKITGEMQQCIENNFTFI